MKKRFLSILTALCLALSLLPVTALAAGDTPVQGKNGTYATITAALDANETEITLTGDVTAEKDIILERSLSLNLGGFTLTLANNVKIQITGEGNTLSIEGGNLIGNRTLLILCYQGATVNLTSVTGKNSHPEDNSTYSNFLQVGSNADYTTGHATITDCNLTAGGNVVYILGKQTSVSDAPSTCTITNSTMSGRNPISGNGNCYANVTIESGTFTSTNDATGTTSFAAVYWPGAGNLTINDGTFSGNSAVYIKSGTVEINGGEFHATGNKEDYEDEGSGFAATGDAIVVDSCNYPGGIPQVAIKAGEFTSANGNCVASYTNGEKGAELVDNFVTGGTFKKGDAVDESVKDYISDDVALTQDPETGEIVEDTSAAVAEVDGVGYKTLQAAINAAKDNETVRLSAAYDATSEDTITMETGKKVVLDLGGATLTLSRFNLKHGELTVQNGSVSCAGQAFNVYAGPSADCGEDYTKLVVKDDATINAAYAICLFGNNNTAAGYNSTIEVYGTLETGGIFVSGNLGNKDDTAQAIIKSGKAPNVYIYEGAVVNEGSEGQGISMNGLANVTISGGTVTGREAIGVKRGTLKITGGTFISDGEYVDPVVANNDGTEATGATISVTSTYNKAGTIEVEITGGTFTSQNVPAVYVGHSKEGAEVNDYEKGLSIDLSGGTFVSPKNVTPVYVAEKTNGDAEGYTKEIVTGGNFSQDLSESEYLAGSIQYQVTHTADGSFTYTETLDAAQEAAKSGDSITDLDAAAENTVTLTLQYNDGASADTKYTVASGTEVPLPTPTRSGSYEFAGWFDESGNKVTGTSYEVTANTTLTAQWTYTGSTGGSGGTRYDIDVPSNIKNGDVSVSPSRARRGQTVTISVKPDRGYVLGDIAVYDADGDEIELERGNANQYQFTMPRGDVEIEVSFIPEAEEQIFDDVPAAYWAYDEIQWAYESGYVNGYSAGTFAPGGSISRQQVWMILARISGADPANMAAARQWAMANGISDGTNPGNAVTRQQLAALLYRFAGLMGYDTAAGGMAIREFPDHASVSGYAQPAMNWAVSEGIIGGTSQGTLNPAGTATRAQFAVMLYRFWN